MYIPLLGRQGLDISQTHVGLACVLVGQLSLIAFVIFHKYLLNIESS